MTCHIKHYTLRLLLGIVSKGSNTIAKSTPFLTTFYLHLFIYNIQF